MDDSNYLVLNEHIASSVQNAIAKTFSSAFQIPTTPELWTVGRNVPLIFDSLQAAQIIMKQESIAIGAFITAINRAVLIRLLNLPEEQAAEQLAQIEGAAGEITNMLFGLFKATVNGEGYRLSMGLPVPFRPEGDAAYERWEKLHLPFLAGGEKCWVTIAQNH